MKSKSTKSVSAGLAGEGPQGSLPTLGEMHTSDLSHSGDVTSRLCPQLGCMEGQVVPVLGHGGLDEWTKRLCGVLGLNDIHLAAHLLSQLVSAGALHAPKNEVELNAILGAVAAFCPRDGAEALLAAQAVVLHQHAMGLLSRAAATPLSGLSEVRLGLAERLMRLFLLQVGALDNHRRRGQQVVRVEHVTVLGQAIVGPVQAGGGWS